MKDQLAILIEAYAAARASGNALLQQYSTGQLSEFLSQFNLVKTPATPPEDEGA
jgi:hypothetical protein